jgi:hypothetical protein
MTIPYVGGWGDAVSQNLPQIASNISGILNPGGLGFDTMQQLKAVIMKDPDLVRKYASIERENPGTLARMGFGKQFGNAIGLIQPSTEEELNREKERTGIEESKSRITESGARTNELKANTKLLDINAQTAQIGLEELQRKNKTIGDLFKKIPDMSKVDIHKLAVDASFGKADPTVLARIQADPTLAQPFQQLQENILKRAQLALEQDRMDLLSKSERSVALRESLQNQRQAEQRLTSLQTLQLKYADPEKLQLARMTARSNPQMAQEVAEYDRLVASNFSDIEDAKKDVKTAKALTMGAFKQNPEFKKIMDQLDADEVKQAKIQSEIDSADREDPIVLSARNAIKTLGFDKVKKMDTWKAMTTTQQKAALGQSPYEDNSPASTSSSKPISKSTPNIPAPSAFGSPGTGGSIFPTGPEARTSPNIKQSGSMLPVASPLGTSPKETSRGTGVGSSVGSSRLTPYEAMMQQMRDVIAGREVGDYSSDIDPIYNMPQGPNMKAITPMNISGNSPLGSAYPNLVNR